MIYLQLVVSSLLVVGCVSHYRQFMPRWKAHVSNSRNYLSEALPCKNDILSFSTNGEEPVVAFLDKAIDVSEIHFPDVGVIYLDGNNAAIGGEEGTEWQCAKKQNATYSYFDEYLSDMDVHDPNTWIEMNVDTAPVFELHMNRVPGGNDAVKIFENSPIHLKLFEEFAVKKWEEYNRDMTTDDFVQRLRTLEGQLTLQLGAKMVHEYDDDNIAFMRPIGEPIRVGEFKGSYDWFKYGNRNPNMDNKTLTAICGHVHCDSEEERVPPRCISTFTPKGHCCPVCGSLFEVQTYIKHLDELELLFHHFREEFSKKNKMLLSDVFHSSIDRVDESDYELRYQIVLIVKDNTTVLDEDLLISTSTLFLSTLGQYWHQTEGFQLVKFMESQRDHSYETSSIVLGIFSFFIFAVIATFYFSVEARNQTRILYRRGRTLIDQYRARAGPAEVEMRENLVEREGGDQMVSLADLSSECESGKPISFANRAFSMSSLNKEGTLIDMKPDEPTSEAENEPAKDADAEGMCNVDLL